MRCMASSGCDRFWKRLLGEIERVGVDLRVVFVHSDWLSVTAIDRPFVDLGWLVGRPFVQNFTVHRSGRRAALPSVCLVVPCAVAR